jgi:hypothetical protein
MENINSNFYSNLEEMTNRTYTEENTKNGSSSQNRPIRNLIGDHGRNPSVDFVYDFIKLTEKRNKIDLDVKDNSLENIRGTQLINSDLKKPLEKISVKYSKNRSPMK